MNLVSIGIIAGVILVALFVLGLILTRLYRRASKEVSFVRTGFGGEKVIMNGGAMVLPVLHEIIPVNMNTLRLEVRRAAQQALITRDRMRVDVMAEFYVRVKPSAESIATAAQTLGMKTMSPDELKDLVEGKFVDALRAVAAEMAMEELHEKRVDFVQKVQQVVSEDLFKNGLELETVSLTGLDQTSFEFFNPQNAFDAEGLTKLTETIEGRRKKRNEIEQDTDLAIKTKNLEAEQQRLKISREEEYAKLEQEREIAVRRAEQEASIAEQEAQKKREAEEAKIAAEREVDLKRIAAERDIKNEDIRKAQAVEQAEVERRKAIELAEQDRAIAVAEYFITLYPYVYATGDLTAFRAMSDATCKFCDSVINNTTSMHTAGGWIDHWEHHATFTSITADVSTPDRYVVEFHVVSDEHVSHSIGEPPQINELIQGPVLVQVLWKNGTGWIIEGVDPQ